MEDTGAYYDLISSAPELRGLPLTAQSPSSREKLLRIRGTLEGHIEAGRMKFVRGAPGVEEIFSQLLSLPDSAHDDLADALEIGSRSMVSGMEDVVLLEYGEAMFHERRARSW